MQIENAKGYMTTSEAARILNVSLDTVLRWCRSGKLQHDWDGHVRRIFVDALMIAYANRHPQGAITK